MVTLSKEMLKAGFLCLGNPDFFKSETGEAQQIIAVSLRNGSQTLKRTILEIFQDYFTNEELKAEILEGIKKEDVDVTSDIGVLTGTATSVNTDEYLSACLSMLMAELHFSLLETSWGTSWIVH
jgi:23S rRNA U2552 (ribose-2'-O)-methylase RlmE/FtsJ